MGTLPKFPKLRHRFLLLVLILLSCDLLRPIFCKFVSSRRQEKLQSLEDLEEIEENQIQYKKPNILVTKHFLDPVFALGWKVEVQYQIFNVGEAPAIDVHLTDSDFSYPTSGDKEVSSEGDSQKKSSFVIVRKQIGGVTDNFANGGGEFRHRIGGLLPGMNFTMNITAVPDENSLKVGRYRFQPALVTYTYVLGRKIDQEPVTQVGWSSVSHEDVYILPKEEADKRYGSKALEICILILMMLPPVLIPLSLWKSHSDKYDDLQRQKDSIKAERKENRKENKNKNKHGKFHS